MGPPPDDWDLIPHRSGPWLLRVGARLYEVPPDRAAALSAGPPAALLSRPKLRTRQSALWFRIPLLSARRVESLAMRLSALTGTWCLWLLVLTGLAGHLAAGLAGISMRAVSLLPGEMGPAVLLFMATALWHELGHAAALQHGGYPPGGIGAGIMFIIPVLYADVSAVSALPRGARLRVDLAGVCFQLAAGGLLSLLYLATGQAYWAWGSALSLMAVVWSLLPFMRTDGYWVLCDLLGVSGLEAATPRGRSAWLRVVLIVYRLLNIAFLGLVGLMVTLRLAGWAARLLPGDYGRAATLLLGAILVWRLAPRAMILLGGTWRDVRSFFPGG